MTQNEAFMPINYAPSELTRGYAFFFDSITGLFNPFQILPQSILIVHYVTRSQALLSSAEYALGSNLHTILYVKEGRYSHYSGSVGYNISKLGNVWGGDFYRTWTVKLMNCA